VLAQEEAQETDDVSEPCQTYLARVDVPRDHILNGAVVSSIASGEEECCRSAPGRVRKPLGLAQPARCSVPAACLVGDHTGWDAQEGPGRALRREDGGEARP
jgi:hypothetical protein